MIPLQGIMNYHDLEAGIELSGRSTIRAGQLPDSKEQKNYVRLLNTVFQT